MVCRQSSKAFLGASSTVWLTKAVDISVGYPVHVVIYTVPTCTARTPKGYTWREIISMKAPNEVSPCSEARARRGALWMGTTSTSSPSRELLLCRPERFSPPFCMWQHSAGLAHCHPTPYAKLHMRRDPYLCHRRRQGRRLWCHCVAYLRRQEDDSSQRAPE